MEYSKIHIKDNVGVIGCLTNLPREFPTLKAENSGNIVHANAPLLILKKTAHYTDERFKLAGQNNFKNFVNETCSHLIITMANTLVVNSDEKKERYKKLRESLQQYKVPIIVFGLGVQSKTFENNAKLDSEAINLLRFLSDSCNLLAVRGEYTKEVIEKNTKLKNIYVVGCPSIYSMPNRLQQLKKINLHDGRASFATTNLQNLEERQLLLEGFQNENFLIEPVSSIAHKYATEILSNKNPEVPHYWHQICQENNMKLEAFKIKDYYFKFYRLFRHLDSWLNFNLENVSYTYGTRFHVNVASILAGKPALWITHDTRTKELVDHHCLPNIDIKEISNKNNKNFIESKIDYTKFFNNLESSFNNFYFYLEKNNLLSKINNAHTLRT